ncbi:hypothetical protein P7C70_g5125, partial [Phenoliferia sp. Uapishka_3]
MASQTTLLDLFQILIGATTVASNASIAIFPIRHQLAELLIATPLQQGPKFSKSTTTLTNSIKRLESNVPRLNETFKQIEDDLNSNTSSALNTRSPSTAPYYTASLEGRIGALDTAYAALQAIVEEYDRIITYIDEDRKMVPSICPTDKATEGVALAARLLPISHKLQTIGDALHTRLADISFLQKHVQASTFAADLATISATYSAVQQGSGF